MRRVVLTHLCVHVPCMRVCACFFLRAGNENCTRCLGALLEILFGCVTGATSSSVVALLVPEKSNARHGCCLVCARSHL